MNLLTKPSYIKSLLDSSQIRLKKKWGQNFMVSPHALDLLVRSAHIKEEDVVIEIGPGLGVLTQRMIELCRAVISVEIDKGLAQLLHQHISTGLEKLTLIQNDFLKEDLKELFKSASKKCGKRGHVRIVANLPYSVTTPVLARILESELPFESMTLTVQKELADRIVAKPGGKDYGAFTVLVQFYTHPVICGKIKPSAFYPVPKVGSAVLDFQFYSELPIKVANIPLFFKVVRTSFGKRRKMLRNNLADLPFSKAQISQALSKSGLADDRRPETLSLKEFAALANALMEL